MAEVKKLTVKQLPEVSIELTRSEAIALVTLLGSGTIDGTLAKLGLTELHSKLKGHYPEAKDCSFEWSAELDYYHE